ncbi:PrsW family intramembrane metalloprotease [Natronorarus salvus]|uniref:PrsW family intramembrane metalloprotease n=1 Tax=Natronorarus salvus TaxID=3117733 RepID=UPI002F269B41
MNRGRDPVERETSDDRDLYEITTWERRSFLDSLAVGIHRFGAVSLRVVLVALAFVLLLAQLILGGVGVLVADPVVGTLVFLSVVPALGIAVYIWYADVTTGEPLSLLVVTFLLAVLFAMFAAVINSVLQPAFGALGFLGLVLFFFLVVGPVEETVKLLAVRLYAYRSTRFDAVIDGMVYGAVAGLGFATIENAFYITQGLDSGLAAMEVVDEAGATAAVRSLAGPGHVLYSAIAGFYLGLAKFNPENAGPIVIKGLTIAAILHALYNSLAGIVPGLLVASATWITLPIALLGFIVLYDGFVAYILYRKASRYMKAYRDAGIERLDERELIPERTEFDP